MKTKLIILGIVVIVVIFILGLVSNKSTPPPETEPNTTIKPTVEVDADEVSIIAENLDTPWGIAFLPDNIILITERPGRVRLIGAHGGLQYDPVIVLNQVKEVGESGLLGIAPHPDFLGNQYVYLYYSYGVQVNRLRNDTINRVVRMKFQNNKLINEQIIVDGIPGSDNHNGGRMHFGPDGYLYITTGDAQDVSQAQDTSSLAGKILRVTDEGKPVSGNPFGNLIYSYGHRNPQGIAWDSFRNLWATEHGRSGVASGYDELNFIQSGKNYGWPDIQGDETASGMEKPILNSGATNTWAPSGAAFVESSLFFGGLKGEALYEAVIGDIEVTELKEHFKGQFGRIRDVVLGPDGMLYITTSNQDGRGNPASVDDRVIRVNPQKL